MLSEEIKKRIDMDLRLRSLNGTVLYLFFLPFILFIYDAYSAHTRFAVSFTLAMIGISILRLCIYFTTHKLYPSFPKTWRTLFVGLSLSHAASFSAYFSLCIYHESYQSMQLVALLVLGGVASAGVVAFTPNLIISLAYLYTLMLPAIFTGFYLKDDYSLSIMMIIFTLFVSSLGLRSTKEYKRSFDIETKLDDQKKELEHMNKIDGLTKVFNRNHFNNEFEKRWERGIRHNISEAVLLIDIDHFKQFNDKHGHLCGDACLIHVASLVNNIIRRKTDLFARFGGEEFAILLADCSEANALKIAENIRASIFETPLEYNGKHLTVSASIGIAVMVPSLKTEKEVLLIAADDAMYEAKDAGRNRVMANKKTLI